MPYIQKNLPAPPQTLSWSIDSYEGGLNNVLSEMLIQDNQATNICNVDFTDDAVIESRNGLKLITSLSGGGDVTFIDTLKSTTLTPRMIQMCNGDVFLDNVKILDNKNIISGVQFNDKYYMINGTEIYVFGKFPQVLSTHIKPWGTPNPNEIVLKVVAPPTDFIPLDNTNTIGMYHYDYTAMTCWYEPCINELNDEFKGVNVFPTSPTLIAIHAERLVIISDAGDPGSIYISDINGAFYYPASLGLHIPPKGDRIVGMEVFTDSIVVGTNAELYAIYGDTNRDTTGSQYTIKRINSHTGFKNNKSICPMHNNLVFVGNDNNIYSMYTTKTDVSILMTNVLNKTVDVTKYPINATGVNMKKTTSVFHKDRLYILIPDLKTILVYSYKFMAWTIYRTNLTITTLGIYEDELILGASYGTLLEFDKDTYDDNGTPFATYWHSKRFSFGDSTLYKKFKEMYVVAHVFENIRSDVKLTYEVDYIDIEQRELISNQISTWGISNFGDRYIVRNISPSLPITIGQRGRYIKFMIYNGYFVEGYFYLLSELQVFPKRNQACYYVEELGKYVLYDTGNIVELSDDEVKQPMKVYSVSGTYQLKGRR
jgi:hypothetical protein